DHHRGHALLAERAIGGGAIHRHDLVGLLVGVDEVAHALRQLALSLDDEREGLPADRHGHERHQHAHAERRQERGGDGARRAQPEEELVPRHAPDGTHQRHARERAEARWRMPTAKKTATAVSATSTATSTAIDSEVTRTPKNAHSSTPTA